MLFRKAISAIFTIAFVISTIFASGAVYIAPLSVFAEENTESFSDSLAPGVYAAPLIRIRNLNNRKALNNSPMHFYGQCMIEVDENNAQRVTIAVENWSLYDVFIPVKQQYISTLNTSIYPKQVFNNNNLNGITNLSEFIDSDSFKTSEAANEWYNVGDSKYGDIDVEINSALDVAYVSFEIEDCTKNIALLTWVNSVINDNANVYNSYLSTISFYINVEQISKIDNIMSDTSFSNYSYALRLLTCRSNNDYFNRTHDFLVTFDDKLSKKGILPFDSMLIYKDDNGLHGKYHITDNEKYYNFRRIKTVNQLEFDNPLMKWDTVRHSDFESINPVDGYITIDYDNILQIVFSEYIYFDCSEVIYQNEGINLFYCMPCLTTKIIEEFKIYDENTGVYAIANTSVLPQTVKLKVEKNFNENNAPISKNIRRWLSSQYSSYDYYNISLIDEKGNILECNSGIDLYVPLPNDFNISDYYTEIITKNGDLNYSQGNALAIGGLDYTQFDINAKLWHRTNEVIDGKTYAILKVNADKIDLFDLNEKGIYSGKAVLSKITGTGALSMANDALCEDVFVTVDEKGEKKMFFKAQTMTAIGSEWYIGGICCADALENSISYTNYAIDDTGDLLDNAGYNAITEIPCIKGGILTLSNGCFQNDKNGYALGVISAAMARMGNTDYEDIDGNELQVLLQFTSLEKCNDSVTLDKVLNEYGYGYQPSALLRKIKQTEIKYNIGKNTASDSTAFTEAYKVYRDPDAKSQDIEAAIKALDAVTTDVAPSAVIKGHDLTVNQWYELSYYVDLGYDVQSDKNAKVVFTLADGRTKTFDVTDDLFVAGQGYRFTLELAAKQMADKIHAKVVFSDGTEKDFSDEYSVKEFLNDYISTGEDENLKAFAQATLNYGAYAQKFFDYNTEDLAAELADFSDVSAEQITDPASAIPKNIGDEIEFAGAALTLEGETSIKLYFNLTGEFPDPDDHTIKYNGKKLEMQASNVSDVWYVTIPGINAKQLGNVFKFTVDGTEYEYSPYTYMNKVLTNWEDTKYPYLHDLLKALYAYSTAANKC